MKTGSFKGREHQQYTTESLGRGTTASPTNFLGLMFKPFSLLFNSSSEIERPYTSPRKNRTQEYTAIQKQKQAMNASSSAAGKRSSSSSHLQQAGLSYINDTSKPSKNSSTPIIDKNSSLVIPKPSRKSGVNGIASQLSSSNEYFDNTSKTRTPVSSSSSTNDTFSMVNPALSSARKSIINAANSTPNLASPTVLSATPSTSSPATSTITSASSSSGAAAAPSGKPKVLCCDKCDGKHETDDCPYYKKKREDHPDAQKNRQIGGTSSLPGNVLKNYRVVRQPGDGSCLFHSMSYGLRGGNASTLRSEICNFIRSNPNFLISDTPLKDWVKWDSGASVDEYARNMSRGSWGGGIEMACVSQIKGCNVHVYERSMLGFKRISAFDHPDNPASRPVVRVLYCGGVHYGKFCYFYC